jgi:DnaD/phage-associated family protein
MENGFGKMGSHIEEKIRCWCAKLSDSLMVEEMKKAVEQVKQYWSYEEAILMHWELNNVRDVKDAQGERVQEDVSKGR